MAREIPLTDGGFALVDDEDYEGLACHRWRQGPRDYASRTASRGTSPHTIFMHHCIIGRPEPGLVVDHINRNGLDNRRCNLRFTTKSGNALNSNRRTSKTGYRGVRFHRQSGLWFATIKVNCVVHSLGYYKDPKEAARAYDTAAREMVGHPCYQNFPNESIEVRSTAGISKSNPAGVPGIRPCKNNGRWIASIKEKGKSRHLGVFDLLDDAIAARKAAETEKGIVSRFTGTATHQIGDPCEAFCAHQPCQHQEIARLKAKSAGYVTGRSEVAQEI